MKFRICIRRVFIFAVILSLFQILTIFHNHSKFRINKQISIASQLLESNVDALTQFVWKGVCGGDIEVLKSLPGFPNSPDLAYSVEYISIELDIHRYGIRIYGYLKPNFTGGFQLKISTNFPSNSELWLSSSGNPNKVVLIAKTIANLQANESEKVSNNITLESEKIYYFEILNMENVERKKDRLSLFWRHNQDMEFNLVPAINFSPFKTSIYSKKIHLPCHMKKSIKEEQQTEYLHFKKLPNKFSSDILPKCSNESKQRIPRQVRNNKGLWKVHEIQIFHSNSTNTGLHGAPIINQTEAIYVTQTYLQALVKQNDNKFQELTPIYLEKMSDDLRHDQYLLEIKAKLTPTPNLDFLLTQRFINENGMLCTPAVSINTKAFVHIVIIVKNQGRWVKVFLENMNKIYEQTEDERFGIIIVDFNSIDIDVKSTMRHTLKPRQYTYIAVEGRFNKVYGQNLAIDSVMNTNDIIFTCDLHLDIPVNMVDSIRKHTVKGLAIFAPFLRRLKCGVVAKNGTGFWEIVGYGLVSMYKHDWTLVGGMNMAYGTKWGGEDWELVDRVLRIGYHVYRLRIPGLVHYYHPREGAWYMD